MGTVWGSLLDLKQIQLSLKSIKFDTGEKRNANPLDLNANV